MTDSDLLVELLQALDAPTARYSSLESYYEGRQRLAFLSKESKVALQYFDRMVANVPRLAVVSLAERLRVTGFIGADVWDDWVRNDLDQLAGSVHREALLYGCSYVIVWADSVGRPRVTVESPKNVTVLRDPVTREVTSAVKRVRTKTTTEAWVYLPDRVEHHRANTPGAATAGFELVETVDNPLGVVPVVAFVNANRLDNEFSEIDDLAPLCDAGNKLLLDMMIASEYSGRPRRYAVGVELVERPKLDDDGDPVLDDDDEPVIEAVNPFPDENRMMVSENPQAKIGQLDATNLSGFEAGMRVITSSIMAVSALPSHYLGILSNQPTSADALRASEASITARAEDRQRQFGRSWEQVARLTVAVRDAVATEDVSVGVVWCDAATRSTAQEADAAVKLYSAGILSRTGVLKRLGLTDDEIAAELANTRTDAQIGADVRLGRYMTDLTSAA